MLWGTRGATIEKSLFYRGSFCCKTSEISCVIRKAQNLKAWAERNASDLWNMTVPKKFIGLHQGDAICVWNDSYKRLLAKAGVGVPEAVFGTNIEPLRDRNSTPRRADGAEGSFCS